MPKKINWISGFKNSCFPSTNVGSCWAYFGATGAIGATGSGATGATGVGFTGATGPSGGPIGATGATGSFAPAGGTRWGFTGNGTQTVFSIIGAISDLSTAYIVAIDGIVQDPNNYSISGTTLTMSTAIPNLSEIVIVSLNGSQGATGSGATGFGATGATGSGATGATGLGSTGATGLGATGATGSGATGATGLGSTGATGLGATGATGAGATGATGAGATGATGLGATGATGLGSTGSTGAGATGATGVGATGATGVGINGGTGATGFQGATGILNLTPTSNSGIDITGNNISTSYNTTIPDSVISVSVGGASPTAASVWKTKNIVQALDDILFPTILASVGSAKSINLTVSGSSGTLEIGSSYSRTLTATFLRGTIIDGNGTLNANPLVGVDTNFTFTGTGISSTTQTSNILSFTTSIVSGSNNWAVTANHGAGTGAYFNNKGIAGTNLDPQRVSGTVTDSSSSPTITGVYPYYYLKSNSPITPASMVIAIQNGTATKVIASSTGTLSIPYQPSAEYLAVAYPNTSTVKTRYFVTALDNGAITVIFDPVSTQSVVTGLWTQNYFIHVSSSALTNSNPIIELRNT